VKIRGSDSWFSDSWFSDSWFSDSWFSDSWLSDSWFSDSWLSDSWFSDPREFTNPLSNVSQWFLYIVLQYVANMTVGVQIIISCFIHINNDFDNNLVIEEYYYFEY
jgi:hypothetical protein